MSATTSGPLALRLVDYWLTVYRRTWRGSVISSFLTPLLYVLAMGVLLGGFVKSDPSRLDGASSYLAFVCPGLVASQTMTTVFGEVTWPVASAIKWNRTYLAMIATPLRIRDVALGHLGFVISRVTLVGTVFVLVLIPLLMCALGLLLARRVMPCSGRGSFLARTTPFALIYRVLLFAGSFIGAEGWHAGHLRALLYGIVIAFAGAWLYERYFAKREAATDATEADAERAPRTT